MTTRRSRLIAGVLALAVGQVPATADAVAPGACVPSAGRLLSPGCPAALTSDVRESRPSLPNLVPDVALPFVLRFGAEPELFFDTQIQNRGPVALDLAADQPDALATTTVSQCVAWTVEAVCRERRPVGGFAWHEPHRHFHYQDFARYELRRVNADSAVDWSDGGSLALSDKVSFCLYDVTRHDPDAPPAPRYLHCTPVQQGISPGWSDIYTPDQAGQRLSLAEASDGIYALVVTLDPVGRLYESDDTDNQVTVTFALSDDRTNVTVLGRTWSG